MAGAEHLCASSTEEVIFALYVLVSRSMETLGTDSLNYTFSALGQRLLELRLESYFLGAKSHLISDYAMILIFQTVGSFFLPDLGSRLEL